MLYLFIYLFDLYQAFTLMKEREKELGFGHLKTHLNLIDSALHGGIPFGALTEVVGPAGFGKTQVRPLNLQSEGVYTCFGDFFSQ